MILLFLFLFTLLLSLTLTRYLYRMPHSHWLSCVNHANERSLHQQPTAGSGGLAILSSLIVGLLIIHLFFNEFLLPLYRHSPVLWYFYAGALLLATVSFIDDQREISPLWRLLTHIVVAYILLIPSELYYSQFPITILPDNLWVQQLLYGFFVVWMINLYNFMDGMDGFAGGMSVFGFGTLAIAGWLSGQQDFAIIATLIVMSNLGFLKYNFPPAKIFMGDVGASTLGYLAAGLILWANDRNVLPLWSGLLAFSPFIIDATVTLLIRISRKEKIWQAHKTHHYQQCVETGWTHKKTVLSSYLLMTACSLSALATLWVSIFGQWLLFITWGLIYSGLIFFIRRKK